MICENPKYIYIRKKYPKKIIDEAHLKRLNKPSMTYKDGWQQVCVPCGKCDACKIEKANEWSTRIINEAEQWDNKGMFITLTYHDGALPKNKNGINTLKRKDIVNFKKRLRKYANKYEPPFKEWENPQTKKIERPIRTFECGEYGYSGKRAKDGGNPHYHMILFNWIVKDLKFSYISEEGYPVYRSKTIEKQIWKKGRVEIGTITYESAAYVARYTMKKNGLSKVKREYYDAEELDEKTGELKLKTKYRNIKGEQEPMFIGGSTCPGLGKTYFLKNKEKIKQNNGILIKTKKGIIIKKIPRYYRKLWEQIDWKDYHKWKYEFRKKYEEKERKEIEKYDLPKEWSLYKKLIWINKRKIENWKAKREMLKRRERIR